MVALGLGAVIGSGIFILSGTAAAGDQPTAIFAANDDMAVGVIRVADRLGIKIPDELSVAGFDDIVLARQVLPTLTTVKQPLAEMAEVAAKLLLAGRSKEDLTTGTKVVPSELKIRESTGPAPD